MGALKQLVTVTKGQNWVSQFQEDIEQCRVLCGSGIIPVRLNTPEKVYAVMLKGREVGLPIMQSLTHIHIIDGKACMSAELMLALVYRDCPKTAIKFLQYDDDGCVIEVGPRGGNAGGVVSFLWSHAEQALLHTKDTWKKYPSDMCKARAIAKMARTYFADIIGGMSYTPEEIAGDRVVLDCEGNVIDIRERLPVDKPVHKSVDKVTDSQPEAVSSESANLKQRQANLHKLFPDDKSAWGWLEREFDNRGLSEDQRQPIRASAVGRKIGAILDDMVAAKITHEVIDVDFTEPQQMQA